MIEYDDCDPLPISVCVPTIQARADRLLRRAIESVLTQQRLPAQIVVVPDRDRMGAGHTRNRSIDLADQEWTAFLDDDDLLYPMHLRVLYECAMESGADIVYPWFDCTAPLMIERHFPDREFEVWDNDYPQIIPVTALVRSEFAKQARFGVVTRESIKDGSWDGDDWPFWRDCMKLGAKIVHLPLRTWLWVHHYDRTGSNTSGLPWRW